MASLFSRLPLSIRGRIPKRLRHVARLARHLVPQGQPSVALSPALLADCRFCASRNDLVEQLPHRARVAEVGTYRGHFARHILDATDPAELHLIDIDFSLLDPDVATDRRVILHRGLSHAMLGQFAEGYFDWIYIDGDHSYEGARRDAAVASTKVRHGGYLAFNDFAHMDPYLGAYGVHRAVSEFAARQRWKFMWFAYEPHGLYDVALQRPVEG